MHRDQENMDADDHARDERIRLLREEQVRLKRIEAESEARLEELKHIKDQMQRKLDRTVAKVENARRQYEDRNNRDDGATN